jgi:hypothetical protein
LVFGLSPGFREALSAVGEADPPAGLDYARAGALRAELASLKARYAGTLAACMPERPDPHPPEDDGPPQLPEPERAGPQPAPSPEAGPLALEAAPNAPEPPKAGDELAIPEEASGFAFLEGCWKVDTVRSEHRGWPFYYVHCFGTDGKARVTAHVDYLGKWRTCSGTARARFLDDGRLQIDTSQNRCSGAGIYLFPRTLRCAPRSGGAAACTLTHHGKGGTTHPTRIVRQAS